MVGRVLSVTLKISVNAHFGAWFVWGGENGAEA